MYPRYITLKQSIDWIGFIELVQDIAVLNLGYNIRFKKKMYMLELGQVRTRRLTNGRTDGRMPGISMFYAHRIQNKENH